MIFFSIGLPGRLADWCDALVRALAARSFGGAEAIIADNLDAIAAAAIRNRAAHLVVCSRQPSIRLQEEIQQSGQPFVVVIGDPRTAVNRLVAGGDHDLAAATRAVAGSCASLQSVTRAGNALAVTEADARDPRAAARAIADHLGIDATASEIADLIEALGRHAPADEVNGAEPALDERQVMVVDGALGGYLTPDGEIASLVWERELFYVFEDPPAEARMPATRAVDLTGRARVVIYGPYISLPFGHWTADVVLAFSAETAGMGFIVDVCAGRRLTQTRIESTGAQVFATTLHFAVDNSVDRPIEVRVLSERAAFEGQLAIGQVTLTRERVVDRDLRRELTEMLQA